MSEYRPPGTPPPPPYDWAAERPLAPSPFPAVVPVAESPAGGLAVASLVCGIVGIVAGLIPLLFLFAWALGLIAVVLGLVARRRRRKARLVTLTTPPHHGFEPGDRLEASPISDGSFAGRGKVVSVTASTIVYDPGGRSTMATWGAVLGAVAFVLGCVGVVVINSAVNDLDRDLEHIDRQLDQDLGTTIP